MSFQTLRLLVTLGLALHFLVRLRLAYGAGNWFPPVALALLVLLLPQIWPGQVQSWPEPAAEWFLAIGPLTLGYILLFFLAALALDLARLTLAGAVALGAQGARPVFLTLEKSVTLALVLAAAALVNAYHMAYSPRLVKVELKTAKLPAGVDELRIVQVSDIHLSRYIGDGELKKMTALVQEAAPDLVVFTGDLLDSPPGAVCEKEAELLAGLKPRFGVFAVLGNHERYFGLPAALDFYRRAGIKLLRGQAEALPGLVVAGVDDEAFGERKDAGRLLEPFRDDRRFILFLKHRPAPAPGSAGLFDLQLSGHTHGGQIWPNHFLAAKANGLLHGLHPAPGRGWIYVSRGAGFWGLPLRLLAPPEVTLFVLGRGL
ncbi:MAG: metallophosphoesterase [Candidatus Adiutrix sp.]|jgi:predicted MPP superfamily phosphohydrolase|nr:metallophosphoesterase [Candidatus Adiutrix sp.]